MPKIATVNPMTGAKIGDAQFQGRTIKVKTQDKPTYLNSYDEKELPQAARQDHPAKPEEAVQTNKNEESVEVKPLDSHHEALARKESAIRAKERELQAEKAAYEARIKTEIDKALADYKAQLKAKPLDELNSLGMTYDQLVEQAVHQSDPNYQAAQETQKRLDAIEANQKRLSEESQNSAKAQRDAAVKQITFDVQDLIDQDASFETIKATQSADDVVNLITRTFDETGKLLSIDQAAKMVEDELFEEALKIANIGKVKAKFKPELTPELVNQSKSQPSQQATTLTNSMSSKRPMSARERAIAVFKGEKI